jgi:hypothetical protein
VPAELHRSLQADAVRLDAQAQRLLLAGDAAAAAPILREAAATYRASWEAAPPGGYGRLVGMLKDAILAGDAVDDATYVRAALAGDESESPTAAYALALASLAIGDEIGTEVAARSMRAGGEAFDRTADALAALAGRDQPAYAVALAAIIADFEARESHLTGVAIADTALALERLAAARGMAQRPVSPVMPGV